MTTVAPSRPNTHPSIYTGRLIPRGEKLYVVRWFRSDGRDVRMRYYRRRANAEQFAARLAAAGKDPAVFTSSTRWKPVSR